MITLRLFPPLVRGANEELHQGQWASSVIDPLH